MTPNTAKPASRNTLLETLATRYPVIRECRPLALGIHKAILEQQPDTDPVQLRLAMRLHTASTRYLKSLAAASERYDLDGQPAGEVTAEQRQVAATALRERFKKQAERKKADEAAARTARQEEEALRQRQEKLAQLAARFNRR